MLVVLAHAGDASAHWAAARLRERGAGPVEEVLVESLGAATTWRHELGADGTTTEIRLLDGRRLRTGEVTSVLNRMLQPPLGYGLEAAEPSTTVLMLGGELLDGEVPDAVRTAVRRFATLAETPILGLRFAGLERDRAEWRLLDATPYPDLSSGGEAGISALEELLAP